MSLQTFNGHFFSDHFQRFAGNSATHVHKEHTHHIHRYRIARTLTAHTLNKQRMSGDESEEEFVGLLADSESEEEGKVGFKRGTGGAKGARDSSDSSDNDDDDDAADEDENRTKKAKLAASKEELKKKDEKKTDKKKKDKKKDKKKKEKDKKKQKQKPWEKKPDDNDAAAPKLAGKGFRRTTASEQQSKPEKDTKGSKSKQGSDAKKVASKHDQDESGDDKAAQAKQKPKEKRSRYILFVGKFIDPLDLPSSSFSLPAWSSSSPQTPPPPFSAFVIFPFLLSHAPFTAQPQATWPRTQPVTTFESIFTAAVCQNPLLQREGGCQ